jgi:hypothetical protein
MNCSSPKKPILFFFYLQGCGPCQHFTEHVWKKLENHPNYKTYKIENQERPTYSYPGLFTNQAEYVRSTTQNINAFPTIYLWGRNGLTEIENRSEQNIRFQLKQSLHSHSHSRSRSSRLHSRSRSKTALKSKRKRYTRRH